MEKDYIEMISSLITIILAIMAIVVFIYYGGDALFYVVVVIAILAAAFNAWMLSNEGSLKDMVDRIGRAQPEKPQQKRHGRTKRKPGR